MPAVRAEDHVVRAQVGADAGGDRLLADVGVAGAVDQPALVAPRQLLLALANQLHGAIERKDLVEFDRLCCHAGMLHLVVFNRLR